MRYEEYLHRNALLCINDGQPTRRLSDSVIDLFIVSPRVVPEVAVCETMSHEAVRSDHIGVLLEVYPQTRQDNSIFEKYIVSKADYSRWQECTEERFSQWNKSGVKYKSVDEMAESFMQVYTECMIEAVPKKEVKKANRRKKPPWWNDTVSASKQELNKAKKDFRRRRTPANFQKLKASEDTLDSVIAEAKTEWTQELCDKITYAGSSKEMWEHFNSLTTYQDHSGGGVLPLIDRNGKPVFDRQEKCKVLEDVFFGGGHLKECDFDDKFKQEVEKTVSDIEKGISNDDINQTREKEKNSNEYLNYDISVGEVEAVLQQLQNNKSPGPDNVFTELLRHAGDELTKAIHRVFQRSWKEGAVPEQWKLAHVKFLRKRGKKTYHDASSYRPISLTSYLCKSLERIINRRLYGFCEHFNILDQEQEGFRRFRGTTDALLRITQDIYNGFNNKEHTAALFIDIEKAYDSVWRDGLMFKLHSLGIRGRIWDWIKSFLDDRRAVIYLGGENGQEFHTSIGLPQGSVISPLLFSLYIVDCYENVKSEKVKFADDGTIWRTGKVWRDLVKGLEEDFVWIIKWARKWRLKLSIAKTEFCIFSQISQILEEARTYCMTVEKQMVKYNPLPKILGITLDEKLKFDIHTQQVERKALRSLDLLRRVKETETVSVRCMLQLYKALITPQLEYAAAVWQVGDCGALEKVQRKGLALCLGVPGTAGVEALEVEAGVKPLCIRREELAVRQAARIMMKPDDAYLKVRWDSFLDSDATERKISPFGKMNVQLADMSSNTGISLHCLEKECTYLESLQPSKRPPEYWQNLGSSKSRSSEQEQLSRDLIGGVIEKCDAETAVIFTDGSCMGNPGPCGAGACLFVPGTSDPVLLKQPVSSMGSILLGELVAIKIALQYIYRCNTNRQRENSIKKAHIFSDSQGAVGQLTLGWEARAQKSTVKEVKSEIERLEKSGVSVELSWTPGHADIKGNEQADRLAKEAAKEAKEKEELPPVISLGDVKEAAKKSGFVKWQEMWDNSEKGRHLFQFRPKVGYKVKNTFETTSGERIISQLRTGYVALNEYLHKVNIKDHDSCECGEIESVGHFLLHCQKYETERELMRKRIFDLCGISVFDLNMLLDMKPEDEFKDWRDTILSQLELYVAETRRFGPRKSK